MTILTKYPPVSGTYMRKMATSILTPCAATPFNPDAFSPAMNTLFDGVKTLQEFGLWGADFYKALPPYPSSGDPFLNQQTYWFGDFGEFAGTLKISAEVRFAGRIRRRTRVVLSDADHTVDVTQGDRFQVPGNNAAPRTIKLKNTGVTTIPSEGECIEIIWVPTPGGGGTQYTVRREDATVVATLVGSTVTTTGTCWAQFEYVSNAWRMGANSGIDYDGTADYGVVPGPGAA